MMLILAYLNTGFAAGGHGSGRIREIFASCENRDLLKLSFFGCLVFGLIIII